MTWTRRQFMVASSLAVAGGALRDVPLLGQQPPAQAPPVPQFQPVRGNVGMFLARGGTIGWLIVPDGVIVVDSQFPDTAKLFLEGLRERTPRPIDVLVNTHHHGDHTAGNAVLRPAARQIVAHVRVPELQRAAAVQAKTEADQVYADTTFASDWSIAVGGETISARHYGPGHTGGDIVVHFQRDDVVHMGDLMFRERHPFVDRPAGASIRNWITTLETVARAHSDGTAFIFGHAKEGLSVRGAREDLLTFRDYFTAVLDHVQKGIAASKPKDEITKLAELQGFERYQGAPPRLTLAGVLGVAYDELTAKS